MLRTQLDFLINLKKELLNTNSSLDKKVILEKFFHADEQLFKKWMDYIYSFDKKYWLSSKNVLKLWDKFSETKNNFSPSDDVFAVLDKIKDRHLTGHNGINYIIDLIKYLQEPQYQDIIFCILNRDLKANVNTALINKITPCVKEFNVALAERFDVANEIDAHKVDFTDGTWQISRKLDGVRTIAMNNNGIIEYFSRKGLNYTTLGALDEQVRQILAAASKDGGEYVLDGEVCLLSENNKDDFSGIMKEIKKINHTIANPAYTIFDLIEKNEFLQANGHTSFLTRLNKLEGLNISQYGKFCTVVQNKQSINNADFITWQELADKNNWEGLILRKQTSMYNGKRTFDLLKFKKFYDAEFTVKDIEVGSKKMLVNQKMEETRCVTAIIIDFKGNNVGVGSGLSDEERITWLKNKDLIIGKIVTVQYFEETVDSKTGSPSLRFPTLKWVHGDERLI